MGMAVVLFVLGLSLLPSAVDRGEASLTEPAVARHDVSSPSMSPERDSTAPTHAFQTDTAADENDDRVPVALATFGAAVAAVVVGSAGYLLRRWLGLIKPPPAQGPEH